MSDLVSVVSFPSRVEAEVAKGLLESQGIVALIVADDAGGARPYPMSYSYGVSLQVRAFDLERAREVLGLN